MTKLSENDLAKIVPLLNGESAIVDDEDFEKVSSKKWRRQTGKQTSYAIEIGNPKLSMHNFILDRDSSSKILPDHVNGNGLDNRKSNLRIATPAENCWNRRKQTRKTKSRYKGVSIHSTSVSRGYTRWWARITHHGKPISLGLHETEEEAAKAYDEAAKELFGEYARTNF